MTSIMYGQSERIIPRKCIFLILATLSRRKANAYSSKHISKDNGAWLRDREDLYKMLVLCPDMLYGKDLGQCVWSTPKGLKVQMVSKNRCLYKKALYFHISYLMATERKFYTHSPCGPHSANG